MPRCRWARCRGGIWCWRRRPDQALAPGQPLRPASQGQQRSAAQGDVGHAGSLALPPRPRSGASAAVSRAAWLHSASARRKAPVRRKNTGGRSVRIASSAETPSAIAARARCRRCTCISVVAKHLDRRRRLPRSPPPTRGRRVPHRLRSRRIPRRPATGRRSRPRTPSRLPHRFCRPGRRKAPAFPTPAGSRRGRRRVGRRAAGQRIGLHRDAEFAEHGTDRRLECRAFFRVAGDRRPVGGGFDQCAQLGAGRQRAGLEHHEARCRAIQHGLDGGRGGVGRLAQPDDAAAADERERRGLRRQIGGRFACQFGNQERVVEAAGDRAHQRPRPGRGSGRHRHRKAG